MFAARVYKLLLRLYPPEFREEFGGEMQAAFRDAGQDQRGPGYAAFAARELLGLVAGAAAQRLAPAPAEPLEFPSDVPSAERYIGIVSRRLVQAIASHDFEGARHYDREERKARALVALLRGQA